MIARYFIDRPVFATVLSVVITLVGGIVRTTSRPTCATPLITPPGIAISISYPGASAPVVADTVAAPIEQQVNGIEGDAMACPRRVGNDGGLYMLTVTFDIGIWTSIRLLVMRAEPRRPGDATTADLSVQNQGITIRKKTPDILMIVNFYSPGRPL